MQLVKQVIKWVGVTRKAQYRWVWCLIATILYFLILLLPIPGFSLQARKALAVFAVTAFLWGTNTLPIAATGLIVLFLIPFSGVLSAEATYSYFGNRAVFFVLGAFVLASPIMRSGLSTRIALAVVSRFGQNQKALIAAILFLSATMSFVISSHAVTAMLFPVVLELVQAARAKPGGRFSVAVFLALAWGAGLGGIATLLGGARAALALAILRKTTGKSISFVEWTLWSIPLVLILLAITYLVLLRIGKGTAVSLKKAQKFLEKRSAYLGKVSQREIGTIIVMMITIFLWITKGDVWGLDVVAFLGVMLSFVCQLADWQEVEEDVNWGIFVMYGSAIALSAVLQETGAATALAEACLGSWINSGTVAFTAIVGIVIFLTEGMSNAAAVAVLMPIALALAGQFNIDPRAMTLGVTIPSGLAFMLPVSTPAIAIVVGSGYVPPVKAFSLGIWLKLSGFIIFIAMAKFYWPLVGLMGNI
ncbi:MAG: DASS family sodium-coupled anion symporter [Cyanobacteria bacterium J083]|nr:MAG: DASS family sodium-coupled anion symporter [Cyanobacteria bacterium J083]